MKKIKYFCFMMLFIVCFFSTLALFAMWGHGDGCAMLIHGILSAIIGVQSAVKIIKYEENK